MFIGDTRSRLSAKGLLRGGEGMGGERVSWIELCEILCIGRGGLWNAWLTMKECAPGRE